MRTRLTDRFIIHLLRASAWLSIILFVAILVLLISRGGSVLSWQFLSSGWKHQDIASGGIFPALVGTVYLGVGVMLVSVPLGILTAVYLTEYSSHGWFRRLIRLTIRNLAGVPSVVYGLFGAGLFVYSLSLGTSLLSAILTLSLMTLPWIVSTSTEALQSVPAGFRAAGFALGASRWQVVWRVILPAALPGCITGSVLGIARAMGETAPIIAVGATFFLSRLPTSPLDKFMALPYHTFILATQHADPKAGAFSAATALVLIATTAGLSLIGILVRAYLRMRKDW